MNVTLNATKITRARIVTSPIDLSHNKVEHQHFDSKVSGITADKLAPEMLFAENTGLEVPDVKTIRCCDRGIHADSVCNLWPVVIREPFAGVGECRPRRSDGGRN